MEQTRFPKNFWNSKSTFSYFRDTLELQAIVYHGPGSKAEGFPGRVRVIAPAYVKFIDGTDTFQSNYTVANVSEDKVKVNDNDEVNKHLY